MRAGEGVGLEPGDVGDGPVRVQARGPCTVRSTHAPSGRRAQCRGCVMSYSSFHAQPSSRPPLAALVAAALDEVQPGGVGDRRARDQEGATSRAWRGRSLS